MFSTFKNLTDLLLTFNTEQKCIDYMEKMRWNGKPVCPHCGHKKAYRTTNGFKCASSACYKKFTVKVGTVFEASNIKLQKWFCAVYLFTAHKKGVSSHQLARDIGVSQKTAWFMLHRVRELFRDKASEVLSGEIQIDETYIGGKRTNKSKSEREALKKHGEGYVLMSPVVGMLQKDGKLSYTATGGNKVDGQVLMPLINEKIEKGSSIVTDGFGGYYQVKKEYQHTVIEHAKNEYVKNGKHTNSIEGAFSQMKRGIYGIYHQVSPKHLQRYCDEFAYRYNSRQISDATRFSLSLSQAEGRLTYNELVYGKEEGSNQTEG